MRVKTLGAARALIAVGSIAAFALTLFATAAGAGKGPTQAAPLTVLKTIGGTGTVPAGTTFTATVACDDPIIYTGEEPVDAVDVTFDDQGQPTSADTIYFGDPGECTVTETATGGATTTTYTCEGSVPDDELEEKGVFAEQELPEGPVCATTGPGPITVNIFDEEQEGTVTILNTFTADPAPAPASQVVAQPAFTG